MRKIFIDTGRNSRARAISRLTGILLLSTSFCANAGYACFGKVGNVTVDPNGEVNASFAFDTGNMLWQDMCNIDHSTNNVSPASCKGILSLLLTAKATNQRVGIWFDNSSGGSCSATDWKPLRDMGWYWGPAFMGS